MQTLAPWSRPINSRRFGIDRRSIAVLLCAAALIFSGCGNSAGGDPSSAPVAKAVFIIVDGIPADVFEDNPTPNMDAVAAEGGYTRAYVGGEIGGASESPTVSAVGYNSLLTGTWANKHNVWDNDVTDPDYRYWDIFRMAKNHDASLTTAIFSTWTDNRTKLIGDGLEAAGGKKLDYAFDGLELDTERFPHDEAWTYIRDIDAVVAAEAARYIRDNGPHLSWVYLEGTDAVAHEHGDSPALVDALRVMDDHVGLIWDAVRTRQENTNEDWLIVVTTDHGRDADTGMDHGGQSPRERTIWIATNSQRLNEHFDELPAIVDIVPSIATHLGLQIPDDVRRALDGRSFID